ncbi:hypothetical protein CPB83DRAFT_861570 [Crepidotus variabilis]|uniref:NACHT domain-containing protein n=1 Tax=Crepidotus variabilis TaxID=179855 RepID=A0A9P6E850_9AGAR|nr:hypothetical protein CPB83DRAFT_861570 [Crepidotus variabilis]
MFENATNVVISGGQFIAHSNSRTALNFLMEHAAPSAFHISEERYDAPKCHPDTRVAVLEDILERVEMAAVSTILWLYGAAGAGKSSIAQTLAETCSREGLLIGSFFFFRAAPLRNNAKRLAASLVYQLARSIPSTLTHITACMMEDPAIFQSSFEDQMERLFLQPLCRAYQDSTGLSHHRKLIILDGLDECDSPAIQRSLLTALGKVFQATPMPIVVLVASRPENHISSAFDSPEDFSGIQLLRISLNDDYNADNDIRLFINIKLNHCMRSHPLRKYIPSIWPLPEDVDSIVKKASGQFIIAATIVRYAESTRHKPHERLQRALESFDRFAAEVSDSPFKELDALYMQIFSGVEDLVTVLAIMFLALGLGGCKARYPRTIASRLQLAPGDVEMHISSLASLMKFEGETQPIRIFHATLFEFLSNPARSQSFYIHQAAVHTHFLKNYLRRAFRSEQQILVAVLYRCLDHLQLAEIDEEILDMLAKLPTQIVGYLLENFRAGDQPGPPNWYDESEGFLFALPRLVVLLHQLSRVLATNNPSANPLSWGRSLEAFHAVFRRDLSIFLVDEATHDLLVLAAFLDTSIVAFPPRSLTTRMGVSLSNYNECGKAHPFVKYDSYPFRLPNAPCSDILRDFLLNPEQSRKLYVKQERFAHISLKCLMIITQTSLPRKNVSPTVFHYLDSESNKDVSEDQESYVWAVCCLSSMLRRAPKYIPLIKALESLDIQFRWLEYYPEFVEEAKEAIKLYLETHKSQYKRGFLDGLTQRAHAWLDTIERDNSPLNGGLAN